MTPQDIESKVRSEWPDKKYEALCEQEIQLELQLAYWQSPEGKQLNKDAGGEVKYEENVRIIAENLKLTRANKEFMASYLASRKRNRKKEREG
jgi:hypothetical protein